MSGEADTGRGANDGLPRRPSAENAAEARPMAYVSDWMSVKDALSYIRQVTGCGVGSALAHLQQASRDGNVSGRERGQRARSERAWYEQVGLDRLEAAWQNFVDQELPTEDQAAFSSETLTALVDGFQEGFEVLRENVTSAWPRREAVPAPTQEIPSTRGHAAVAVQHEAKQRWLCSMRPCSGGCAA